MVTLRCTQKLLKRLRMQPSGDTFAPSSPLGDWYAAPFSVGHARLVMCVSESSLLPVFVRSQSRDGLIARFREAVLAVLQQLDVSRSALRAERQHLADVVVGITVNRSVLGSMNDFAVQGRWYLKTKGEGNLLALALDLADIPCGPLQYRHPRQVVRELLRAV
jgi:hypothetical protein